LKRKFGSKTTTLSLRKADIQAGDANETRLARRVANGDGQGRSGGRQRLPGIDHASRLPRRRRERLFGRAHADGFAGTYDDGDAPACPNRNFLFDNRRCGFA
jgi:hypothetical protein